MSASWNKRIYNPPALPVELWQKIIEIATYIPGILEPEVWKLADRPSDYVIRDQQKELRASLVTKRYLVRVSKHWFAMATPYLYEAILIGRQRTLLSLCEHFQHFKAGDQISHNESRHLGWYTKRLDFAARDTGDFYPDRLAEAIRYLPNLSIFNLTPRRENGNGATFTCVARALAETCGPRLRLLNLSMEDPGVMRDEWQQLLSSAPNLLALHRPDVLVKPPVHASASYLAKLKSLITPSTGYYEMTNLPPEHTHTSPFPNLQHVEIPSITNYNGPYGGDNQITVLRIYVPGAAWYWAEIERYFANIHRLVLFLEHWEDFPETFTVPLSVTHLSLSCRRMQGRASTFERLFGIFAAMHTNSANLRSVSLVSGRIRQYLRSRHPKTLALGMESIKECSFVLEDDEGRPFA
ncbi:hypothetical protein FIBSPDRAFT_123227 [Athelia psychrophila]|uniref:F-box domain-containing protein n=1 Tax=Athelia psychrophila TaxID=1759441 RepID=A0A166CMR8_9AGAM|nr:hypothetical protein FIBSPDRAFT_123227 [Fibularhizoctonia sp. CBS 109695]